MWFTFCLHILWPFSPLPQTHIPSSIPKPNPMLGPPFLQASFISEWFEQHLRIHLLGKRNFNREERVLNSSGGRSAVGGVARLAEEGDFWAGFWGRWLLPLISLAWCPIHAKYQIKVCWVNKLYNLQSNYTFPVSLIFYHLTRSWERKTWPLHAALYGPGSSICYLENLSVG